MPRSVHVLLKYLRVFVLLDLFFYTIHSTLAVARSGIDGPDLTSLEPQLGSSLTVQIASDYNTFRVEGLYWIPAGI